MKRAPKDGQRMKDQLPRLASFLLRANPRSGSNLGSSEQGSAIQETCAHRVGHQSEPVPSQVTGIAG